jgi:hypothetical protein
MTVALTKESESVERNTRPMVQQVAKVCWRWRCWRKQVIKKSSHDVG